MGELLASMQPTAHNNCVHLEGLAGLGLLPLPVIHIGIGFGKCEKIFTFFIISLVDLCLFCHFCYLILQL